MADQNQLSIDIGISDLLEAGLHFGHQTKRWNPKMKRFIFNKQNGIYVIDLSKTLFHLKQALMFIHDLSIQGKHVVFVGTKRLTQDIIKDAATRCGQYYVIHRWLGGTLTNHQNIRTSIAHMREIEALQANGAIETMPQKEASRLRSELERLQRNLGGIADMKGMPGALIVIDITREMIAVREANRTGIPVVALVDTNCDPDNIDYPIPGNDDAVRSIKLIINLFADAVIQGQAKYESAAAMEIKKEQDNKKTKAIKTEQPEKKAKAPAVQPAEEKGS